MPRQQALAAENKFTKGLITESTALSFPTDACTETFDCVFDETGRVTRRLGLDYEDNYVLETVTLEDGEVFTEFVWYNVGGQANFNYYVQQQGATLHFYDLSSTTNLSDNKKSFTLDLNDYIPDSSAENPALRACQYAVSDGDLVVVNPVCDPFYAAYIAETDSLTVTEIVLKIRDFEGVDDGLTLNQRPTNTVANLITGNPEHYYNLLNQGWYVADALSQWDTARTDMPSNADIVSMYRSSETDAFDNTKVTAKSPGNTPAPKGHFILEVTEIDRPTAITDDGLTGVGTITSEVAIGQGVGSTIGNATDAGGLAAAFDGTTNQSGAASAVKNSTDRSWVGKNFGGPSFRITKAIVHGPNNGGYLDGGNAAMSLQLLAKVGAPPTTFSDGTSLGLISFTDTDNESSGRTITSSDTTTHWNHAWVRSAQDTGFPTNMGFAEVIFYTVGSSSNPGGLEPFSTTERPSTVAHLNSRLFYAGIDNAIIGNNVYFTQIIESDIQREQCYQQNDPTSEELSDLLPSDGGVVRIPDMGQVKKLFASRNSLLVFATNGVWLISGSQGQGFLANDYVVSRLSNVGCDSPLSFIDYKGTPIWWAEDGIYTVEYNADYNSYNAVSLTDETIKSFFLEIPAFNRKFVKGTYDTSADLIQWAYNDSATLEDTEYYTYNKILNFNPRGKSFYPWTIGDVDGPTVRGLIALQDGERNDPQVIKFVTTINIDADEESLTFSEARHAAYRDWVTYADGVEDDEADYTSYFITGYRLDGKSQRFFQPNYVFVFLETEDDASCFMQGIYDFTNSGSSGKWSSRQQVYNDALQYRDVNYRRLKVRGKGRALQLKFASESRRPFTIIGWSMLESINSGL